MLIPWESLSTEALNNIIETTVLTEGTDYGEEERDFASKVNELRQKITSGEALIYFCEDDASISIRANN